MAKEHVNRPHPVEGHKEHDKDKPKPKKGEPGYVGAETDSDTFPGGPTGKGDSDGDDDGD